MGPFLAIPYFDHQGRRTDFVRYKPDHPRISVDSSGKEKPYKYESPRGISTRPYFPPSAFGDVGDGRNVFFTEGEKKAVKATEEGFCCIGLPGITNWSAPRPKDDEGKPIGKRELHLALREIDWSGRRAFIAFDTDQYRNPDVNRESAELARVLEDHGAKAYVLSLPALWNPETRHFDKQGLDDYLVRNDAEEFRRIINYAVDVPTGIPLDLYRQAMRESLFRIKKGRRHVNKAFTGTGKSYADVRHAQTQKSSMFLVPTHSQADDLCEQADEIGIDIRQFPIRSERNCSNMDAIREAESNGFNPTAAICAVCPERLGKTCKYHQERREVERAPHVCTTHARARLVGPGLLENRDYVSVQEDMIGMLAPIVIAADGFEQLLTFFSWAEFAYYWEKTEGEDQEEERYAVKRFNVNFCREMGYMACRLLHIIKNATRTDQCSPYPWFEVDVPILPRHHVDRTVYEIIRKYRENNRPQYKYSEQDETSPDPPDGFQKDVPPKRRRKNPDRKHLPLGTPPKGLFQTFDKDAVRFLMLLMSGRISRFYVRVTPSQEPDGESDVDLVGIFRMHYPDDAATVFSDATADLTVLPPECNKTIVDLTPKESPEQLQKIIQYPNDVKQSTRPERVVEIVRQLLRLHPDKRRVGIITHMKFESIFSSDQQNSLLTSEEKGRIVKTDHFHGTQSRGCNRWKEECDLLIVLGTPRVPPSAIIERLLQLGMLDAAKRDGRWANDYWSGRRLDGTRITVRSKGYRDRIWHHAYGQLVHAELIQSIGRSRLFCPDGIPLTIVVTNEELGYPIADEPLTTLTRRIMENAIPVFTFFLGISVPSDSSSLTEIRHQSGTFGAFSFLTANFSKIFNKDVWPLGSGSDQRPITPVICTQEIADHLKQPLRTVRRQLAEMEDLGLITRKGRRGGFFLTKANYAYFIDVGKSIFALPSQASTNNEAYRYGVPGTPIIVDESSSVFSETSIQVSASPTVHEETPATAIV